jgi:glycopeptide antibiotics resistance protein
VCDVSRVGLIPLRELTRVNEASLNVLLFVPLGLAVAMLPRTRGAALVALGAVALPFVVEGLQLVVTVLGRGCQTADVFDNLLGLAVGFALGTLGRAIVPGLGSTRDA